MWYASGGWMQLAVDAGVLKGSAVALFAYVVLHSPQFIYYIRCRLLCRGPRNEEDSYYRDSRETTMGARSHFIDSRRGTRVWGMLTLVLVVGMPVGTMMTLPSTASAAQGHWWGSPVNPGFDRNTVIQATGTASQVDIEARSGPCTLSLQTQTEKITVILGPSWYLYEQRADIQNGDPLVVEGAKMMDRRGQLHLVASQVTNQRTGAVLRLRDEAGRPLWTRGSPQWKR
jgi:hypothetical protein